MHGKSTNFNSLRIFSPNLHGGKNKDPEQTNIDIIIGSQKILEECSERTKQT